MLLSRIVPDRFRSWAGLQQEGSRDVDRVYVIGDIHGRLDLFARLVSLIREDHAARGPCATRLVLLGDLVDRGPESAMLVEWCRMLAESSDRFVVLKGNHEALMVEALSGNVETMALWLQLGGRETLVSWGVSPEELQQEPTRLMIRQARRKIGSQTLSWLSSLPLMNRHEGYAFVHAGVRPGLALDRQREDDLLWIRGPFLDSKEDHGAIVVHGHTITEGGPDIRHNRINIDTGAYRTGMLTAIGIESGHTWFLSTETSTSDEAEKSTTTWLSVEA